MQFLRLSVNDDYIHGMDHLDVADLLRSYCRRNRWIWKRKWWWSMFWWDFNLLLVNAYVSYKQCMEMMMMGLNKIQIKTHCEFYQSIGLAWLDKDKYQTTGGKEQSVPKKKKQAEQFVRGTKINDKATDPNIDNLACHFNIITYSHIASSEKFSSMPGAACQLPVSCTGDSWTKNTKRESNCCTARIVMSPFAHLSFYTPFHAVRVLVAQK